VGSATVPQDDTPVGRPVGASEAVADQPGSGTHLAGSLHQQSRHRRRREKGIGEIRLPEREPEQVAAPYAEWAARHRAPEPQQQPEYRRSFDRPDLAEIRSRKGMGHGSYTPAEVRERLGAQRSCEATDSLRRKRIAQD